VHRKQAFDGLELDHDATLDEDVDAVAAVDEEAFVGDTDGPLPLEAQAEEVQLAANARFVRRLEEARTKLSVNLDEGPDDPP
jgi:hypothetical protein